METKALRLHGANDIRLETEQLFRTFVFFIIRTVVWFVNSFFIKYYKKPNICFDIFKKLCYTDFRTDVYHTTDNRQIL